MRQYEYPEDESFDWHDDDDPAPYGRQPNTGDEPLESYYDFG